MNLERRLGGAINLERRLIDLDGSLSDFKATDNAGWQVGEIFNALLDEVKKDHGDDPVAAVIRPAESTEFTGETIPEVGALRASIAQLLAIVRDKTPARPAGGLTIRG
jgi:hypothetical protein